VRRFSRGLMASASFLRKRESFLQGAAAFARRNAAHTAEDPRKMALAGAAGIGLARPDDLESAVFETFAPGA
jgi:hypothetical protein